jgi:hypothetical protein
MSSNSILINIEVLASISKKEYEITVPIEVYNQIDKNLDTKLKVGALELEVSCSPNNTINSVFVSNTLADAFGLYSNLETNIVVKRNKICLGPVVAFFTETSGIYYAMQQASGYKMWATARANKYANTILYYFSVKDVDYEGQRINGTYYNYKKELWEQRLFPFPDILNDRGGGVLKSQLATTGQIRKVLDSNKAVRRLNPKYIFDKWEIHNELSKCEEIVQHLPQTVLYENSKNLSRMLEKYSLLYIKDSYGNRGLGVSRVSKLSDGTYKLSYVNSDIHEYHFDTFKGLVRKINILFRNKKTIIQSAIDVIKIDNGNVDMRATVQRNGKGELEIVAYPVRLGKEGAPITSTRSGSEVYTFENFFEKFLKYNPSQIKELMYKVDRFLLSCYRRIEDLYGEFGEIGIDFAIDNQGKIWFIECNAKPGKNTVYQSCDKKTIRKAFLNPLEYSKYKCGF